MLYIQNGRKIDWLTSATFTFNSLSIHFDWNFLTSELLMKRKVGFTFNVKAFNLKMKQFLYLWMTHNGKHTLNFVEKISVKPYKMMFHQLCILDQQIKGFHDKLVALLWSGGCAKLVCFLQKCHFYSDSPSLMASKTT